MNVAAKILAIKPNAIKKGITKESEKRKTKYTSWKKGWINSWQRTMAGAINFNE